MLKRFLNEIAENVMSPTVDILELYIDTEPDKEKVERVQELLDNYRKFHESFLVTTPFQMPKQLPNYDKEWKEIHEKLEADFKRHMELVDEH